MSTIEATAATKALTPTSRIVFEVFSLGMTKTQDFTLAELNITQEMIDREGFDLEQEIDNAVYNWAHDQVQTRIEFSEPLEQASCDTQVIFLIYFNGEVGRKTTYKLKEVLRTKCYPIVSPNRQLAIRLKLNACYSLINLSRVETRWQFVC